MVAFYVPITLNASPPPSIVYTDSDGQNTSLSTTVTFSGKNFGPVKSTRWVVCGIAHFTTAGSGHNLTATIDGIPATRIVNVGNTNRGVAFFAAQPTSTSGNIVFSLSEGISSPVIGVWAVYDILSITPVASASSFAANPIVLSLNFSTLGVGCFLAYASSNLSPNITWSGVTADFNSAIFTTARYSGASYTAASAQTPLAVSASYSQISQPMGVSVSFR